MSADAPAAVAIVTATIPSTRLAQSYSVVLQASGGSGTFVWTLASGALPQGIVLDGTTGLLHGRATSSGRFTFVAKVADASDAANSAVGTFTLTVLAEAPPSTYLAISDRTTREKGTLPALGPAGYAFQDPVFGSRIFRITDGATRPGALDRSIEHHRARTPTRGAPTVTTSTPSAPTARSFLSRSIGQVHRLDGSSHRVRVRVGSRCGSSTNPSSAT